jgi:pro-apoptotic serine protease NMA111
MTFDSVPWVVTMKKNEHYFPTMEWIKDPAEECGWRRVTYEGGQVIEGEGPDGVMPAGDETTEMDVDVGAANE